MLRILPGKNHITINKIRTSPADTSTGDVFEATARAARSAYGMPDHDVSLRETPLIECHLTELHGRTPLGVTESRYWLGGARDGDVESLVCPWFHFEQAPPIQLQVHGEDLSLAYEAPYSSCDVQEYGEVRGSPAQQPDLLAAPIGQHLRSSAVFANPWTSDGHVGAILFEFSANRVLIAASADEWVLVNNPGSH